MVITILWVDFDICNFLYCCILLQKAVKKQNKKLITSDMQTQFSQYLPTVYN